MTRMTLSMKRILAEEFEPGNPEKSDSMMVLVSLSQVLAALELLQQLVLEGSSWWEQTLMKLKGVQQAGNKANKHTDLSKSSTDQDTLKGLEVVPSKWNR